MPLDLQAKLLRVLQEHEITRIGSVRPQQIDVRVISATQVPLAKAVEEGRFRADLYYRLEVVPIHLPSLRQRPEDIPALADSFLERAWRTHGGKRQAITEDGMAYLQRLAWPGNVRQLENLIQRAHLLCATDYLDAEEFSRLLRHSSQIESDVVSSPEEDFMEHLQRHIRAIINRKGEVEAEDAADSILPPVERVMIETALQWASGNQLKASALLGYNRNTLRKRISELDIDVDQIKQAPR